MATATALEFAGEWVGETMGCDMPAHVWEIRVIGDTLMDIHTRWEDKTEGHRMSGYFDVLIGAFSLGDGFTVVRLDSQHFVLPGWDTNDTRGGAGPHFDVVFSRPGIAELSARRLWEKWRELKASKTGI